MLQDDRLLVPLIMSPSEQYRKEWHGGRCRGAARTFERKPVPSGGYRMSTNEDAVYVHIDSPEFLDPGDFCPLPTPSHLLYHSSIRHYRKTKPQFDVNSVVRITRKSPEVTKSAKSATR